MTPLSSRTDSRRTEALIVLPDPLFKTINIMEWGHISRRVADSPRWARGHSLVSWRIPPTMASENPTWGAPRIHGELLKLGFEISERTVSRYLVRLHPRDVAAQLWRTFLKNHRELIARTDVFTVITANFRILFCLFLIQHDRREIIHLDVTEHPTGETSRSIL